MQVLKAVIQGPDGAAKVLEAGEVIDSTNLLKLNPGFILLGDDKGVAQPQHRNELGIFLRVKFRTIANQATYDLPFSTEILGIEDFQFGNTPMTPEQYKLENNTITILDPSDSTNIPANVYCKVTYFQR